MLMRICWRTLFLVRRLGRTSSVRLISSLSSLCLLRSPWGSQPWEVSLTCSVSLLLLLLLGLPSWARPSQNREDAMPWTQRINGGIILVTTYVANSNARATETVLISQDKIGKLFYICLSADTGIKNSVDFVNQKPASAREYQLKHEHLI